ncbi:ABC transporter permease [Streptomyces sp. NPDC048172]|uniref:DUF7224 domain-containing protein n=1 Tax=Streptomyces sp. NPDC048172 TaxID=3365505 RepID=UPI00371433AF
MWRVYRIELRRSPLLAVLPVLLAVDMLVLFGRQRYWIGVWPEASAAAQVVTLFLGTVLAAVSAWQAGRGSRAGMPEAVLGAARPGWQVESMRLAATLTLGFAAYGSGCAVAAAVSFPDAGPGFLWPSYLLLGAATLVVFAAAGHLAGRFWPSPAFTPVLAGVGGFLLMLGVGDPWGWSALSGAPDQMLRPGRVAVRVAFALALAALAVLVPHPRRRSGGLPRPRSTVAGRLAVLAAAAASLATLAGVAVSSEIQVERPSTAVEPLCRKAGADAPRVCVWPEHRRYLPELTAMADRLSRIPQDWVRTPETFREFGLRRTRLGDAGFDITEGHVRTAAIAMAVEVSRQSFGDCRIPGGDERGWRASDRIDLWLEYRAMGVDPGEADDGLHMSGAEGAQGSARRIVRATEADQRAWTSRQRAVLARSLRGCGEQGE